MWKRIAQSGKNGQHIIVVGAGVAGLAAAHTLQKAGVSVTVLEARERIGGRIWTDDTLGAPIDMGASWIHGADGNPITKLAAKHNIKTVPSDDDSLVVYHPDGSLVPDAELDRADVEMEDFAEEVLKFSRKLSTDTSIAQGIQTALAEERLSATEQWWLESVLELDYAAPLEELSLFYALEDEAFDGVDRLFPGGYRQIPAALARGLDIRLNEPASAIRHSNKGVTVETNAHTHTADAVIVTLPLGVLKTGTVRFDPVLPPWKTEAIQRLGMGYLEKVVFRFPEVFWDEAVEFVGLIDSRFPLFMDLNHITNVPILLGFTIRATHGLTDDDAAQALRDLKRAYGSDMSAPVATTISHWGADPLAGGSYSARVVGSTSHHHNALAKPVNKRLFFAGEATHQDYNATVHGAYLSGIRAAKQALK